ncbi:hypothetical protein RFF05_05145 [Bengtsoniella intestinalis]|uniref:hypothetical protein n=1 Tax=Bengtsoniella intestinalis TaxID=3073143 RepID=UPI00391EE406
MEQDNNAIPLTKGVRPISANDFFFDGKVEASDDTISFYTVFSCNVDEIFGTHVETDHNDGYINVYATLDLKTCSVQDVLLIVLWQCDSCTDLSYQLSNREKAIIRTKMDEHMRMDGGTVYHCPHCGHAQTLQVLRMENATWQSICDACGHSFQVALENDGNVLRNSIQYCHGDQIVCTPYYKHLHYHCRATEAESPLNTVPSCMSCPKQGCHIHTTAQDVELLLNGETTPSAILSSRGGHHHGD